MTMRVLRNGQLGLSRKMSSWSICIAESYKHPPIPINSSPMPSAVQYKLLAALGTQLSRQLKVGEELPSVLRVALLAFGRLRTYTKNL